MVIEFDVNLIYNRMLRILLIVGAGSFIGGISRYLISKVASGIFPWSFPLGTFLANMLGCFAIGLFYGLFERNNLMSQELRLFLTVGFCGGFTTFSTFMNECFLFMKDGNYFYMSFYVAFSLFGGLLMLYLGNLLIRIL